MNSALVNLASIARRAFQCDVIWNEKTAAVNELPWIIDGTFRRLAWTVQLTEGCLEALLLRFLPKWNSVLTPGTAACSMTLEFIAPQFGLDPNEVVIERVHYAAAEHQVLRDEETRCFTAAAMLVIGGRRYPVAFACGAELRNLLEFAQNRQEWTGGFYNMERITSRFIVRARVRTLPDIPLVIGRRLQLENLTVQPLIKHLRTAAE